MERTTRRTFCSAAALAVPALPLLAHGKGAGENDVSDRQDLIFNALAGEFVRVTADGAQFGFKAEHFRRYAGFIRVFDAHMESTGLNREFDKRLDEDDFHRLDPARAAKSAVDFWRKHDVDMPEDELTARLMMDRNFYIEGKKAIKKLGGIRAVYAKAAEVFERKAKEYETSSFRGNPVVREGRIVFPRQNGQPEFMKVQLDYLLSITVGFNLDCLCRAMVVAGAASSLLCILGVPPLCIPGATLLALEKLMEGLRLCDPGKC